jgi:hypothetical protein
LCNSLQNFAAPPDDLFRERRDGPDLVLDPWALAENDLFSTASISGRCGVLVEAC